MTDENEYENWTGGEEYTEEKTKQENENKNDENENNADLDLDETLETAGVGGG